MLPSELQRPTTIIEVDAGTILLTVFSSLTFKRRIANNGSKQSDTQKAKH